MGVNDRWLRIAKAKPKSTSEHVSIRQGKRGTLTLAVSLALTRRHFTGFKAAVLFTDAAERMLLVMPVTGDTEGAVVLTGMGNLANKNAVIASNDTIRNLFKELGFTPELGAYKAEWDFTHSGVVVSFDVRVDPRAAMRKDCTDPYVVV